MTGKCDECGERLVQLSPNDEYQCPECESLQEFRLDTDDEDFAL